MKAIIIMVAVGLLSTSASQAQIKNAKTETMKVYGNCDMCETTIEKAGSKTGLYKTDWNVDTKMATITYDSKKTNANAVLKSIALSGYDNINYLAPDDAYAKLPGRCKYDREKKAVVKTIAGPTTNATGSMPSHDGNTQGSNTIDVQETSQLKAVIDNYFALKDALVKTDGPAASTNALAMLTALNAVKMETLKTDEHVIWMKVEKALKFDATHISENKEPAHQREHFMALSKNMYELIKVSKPAETVYYQFCPMANDGKGANWLSKESTIKNPYYGSQMLTCGKTVETIKQ
jgi:copper chaperone CopZ